VEGGQDNWRTTLDPGRGGGALKRKFVKTMRGGGEDPGGKKNEPEEKKTKDTGETFFGRIIIKADSKRKIVQEGERKGSTYKNVGLKCRPSLIRISPIASN